MVVKRLADFAALQPFFRIIQEGLTGVVDGGHFFELFAEDAITEFVITVPGYPKTIQGRDNLAELYRGYSETIVLESAGDLVVYRDTESSVVILEYAVRGRVVATGRPYHNRFVSIITVRNRKVTHWRDYLNPLAVFEALGTALV
jgi:uncharacterized protein